VIKQIFCDEKEFIALNLTLTYNMLKYPQIEFYFPIELSSKKAEKERFVLEGFAIGNDFDLQNDIVSDSALRKATKRFKEKGKVCLNHTKRIIGKVIDCHFTKGKLWVKLEITEPEIIEKIKSGELNCLSVKGQFNYNEFERITPLNKFLFRIVKDASFEEVSLVPQGANPEAKAIQWYVQKAFELAENIMNKNLKEDFENLSEIEEEETEDIEESEEEKKTEDTEEEEEEEKKEEGETEGDNTELAEKAEKTEEGAEEDAEKKTEEKAKEGIEEEAEEEKTELAEGAWKYCVCPKCGYSQKHEVGKPCGKIKCPKCGVKLEGSNSNVLETEKELYVEKSAYTKCMDRELKKGTPFKEVAKKCSKDAKSEGKVKKILQVEKSAYTDCMKSEMNGGKSMEEATKICKKTVEKVEKKSNYSYGYPYAYPYRYPKRVEKTGEATKAIESIEKLIGEITDKKAVPILKKIKVMLDKIGTYPYPYPEKKNLSENENEKIVYQIINSGDIELGDGSRFEKELLRTGTWFHGAGKNGILEITKDVLKKIIQNFKAKVIDNVFVPLGHPVSDSPSKNTGEVVNLKTSEDGEKLLGEFEIKDESTAEKIKKGLIKGISASIAENYMKKDTGEQVGPTLFHAALVSEPYVKGMAGFVPLSEATEDSLIIPILNMEAPLTLEELSVKIEKVEQKLKLSETSEEESSEEESSDEISESSKVGGKTEEEEEEKKAEETETEETETEEAEAEKGVDLADAEKEFERLLRQGKVVPVERELLVSLMTSNQEIQLSGGRKIQSGQALIKYLDEQSPKFSLKEEGTSTPKAEEEKKGKGIPKDVNEELEKMGFSDDQDKQAVHEEFKKEKEEELTPF